MRRQLSKKWEREGRKLTKMVKNKRENIIIGKRKQRKVSEKGEKKNSTGVTRNDWNNCALLLLSFIILSYPGIK